MNITIPRRRVHYKPLVWQETHELIIEMARRWRMPTIVATYHVMAEVASRFDTVEEYVALAQLQPGRLAEGAEELQHED